jgi:KUP system potassium uptake protein
VRVPGTAVFLNRNKVTAPLAMRASVKHLHALNEHVVILSIETQEIPHVPPAERIVIDDLGYTDDGITHATARFGYMDQPNVPAVMRLIESRTSNRRSTWPTPPTSSRRSTSAAATLRG